MTLTQKSQPFVVQLRVCEALCLCSSSWLCVRKHVLSVICSMAIEQINFTHYRTVLGGVTNLAIQHVITKTVAFNIINQTMSQPVPFKNILHEINGNI